MSIWTKELPYNGLFTTLFFSAAMVRCPIIYFGARGDQYKNPKFSISFRIMSIFIIFAIHFQIIVHIYTSFQNLMFYQYRHSITNCLNQFHTNDCDILWKHHTISTFVLWHKWTYNQRTKKPWEIDNFQLAY